MKKLAACDRMLNEMVGMSLTEKSVRLHREMPDVSIKRTTLSRIYKEYGIKFKVIKKIKVVPDKSQKFVTDTIAYLKHRLNHLKEEGIPVVYADESVLSTRLLLTHQWMSKGQNIQVDDKKLNEKTLAFVVGLSEDKGLVLFDSYPRSLDQYRFIEFLKKIRKIYG